MLTKIWVNTPYSDIIVTCMYFDVFSLGTKQMLFSKKVTAIVVMLLIQFANKYKPNCHSTSTNRLYRSQPKLNDIQLRDIDG